MLFLGMGTGHCGLNLLTEILSQQVGANVTHEESPLLPWVRRPEFPGVPERISRWKSQRAGSLIGDCAPFYLPYTEEALAAEPDLRIVCLERPAEEVIAAYCRQLDRTAPFPTNHWARTPAPGWYHDPLWTQTFPQYDTPDRLQGLRLYCDEYAVTIRDIASRYPDRVLILDTLRLTTTDGVEQLLDFLHVPAAARVIVTGKAPGSVGSPTFGPAPRFNGPLDPRRCVVLVPFGGYIHRECDDGLKELERRGYQVRRVSGYAAIDQGRNQMSTDALLDGFDETLWIDSDVAFDPDDVEKLRAHNLPITCGIYPQKGKRALACHIAFGIDKVTFGEQGGLVEMLYAGTGFLLIRRQVYIDVLEKLGMPVCNERFGHPMFPFFHPMIRPIDDGHWYLAEDYAFCERARRCGYKIFADTSIRLWHIGNYRYGWEDAGMDRPRFTNFALNLGDPQEKPGRPQLSAEDLVNFIQAHPWPAEKPVVPPPPDRNWLFPQVRRALTESLPKNARLIVEVGSWLGRSTRFLADLAPRAKVIAIDHWQGSPEHTDDPELIPLLPVLYETFLAETWDYRQRVIPVRAGSVDGMRHVAESNLQPDLVYIDADHGYEAVKADVTAALDLFPRAVLVGDDWNWPGVQKAVEEVAKGRRLKLEVLHTAWRIARGT